MRRQIQPFDPSAYDAGCLALRTRLDRLARLEALGRADAVERNLTRTARDLDEHFEAAFVALGIQRSFAPDAQTFPRDLPRRDALPGQDATGGRGARCLIRQFRQAHALVMESLPWPVRESLDRARRRTRRTMGTVLALAACAAVLILAWPALRGVWHGFERANFVHDFVLQAADRPGVRIAGVYGPEVQDGLRWRWGWGTRSIIALELNRPEPVRLDFAVSNPLEGQTLSVIVNGETLAHHGPLPAATGMARSASGSVRFQGKAGLNAIVIEHPLMNHFTFTGDDTPYSVAFLELVLSTGLRAGR
ncbi:hypothetical protein NNJEOMEG_02560 [Fundidesulfovibrio magnetotacticus]|uniref:DUF4115 domain-containing protein n=1 Tax=Fundidesulfovibrio magnetotacticus TaxID=2730080 RepID=A0A6V8LQC0_9BACT|nr:hypothetical protein [Fundidesulfovibrio magnetotacticus]GFK94713.1 hypothetical protein NNJEOMEG_02560 [Fundidesulfovibrio magnetotacticus]